MNSTSGLKVGVYVDVANLSRNGGRGMRFDILRDFAARDHMDPVRLNVYVAYDERRSTMDHSYKRGQDNFHSALRDFGYKVIVKTVKWYKDDLGGEYGKANADLDMAVDALLQSENLDRVLLATGDGDFVQVVRALQNKGCRVEVVAFDNVSHDLRREADLYFSGYLIPNLLPSETGDPRVPWGESGSRIRGVCYSFQSERMFGFLRYLKHIGPGLWRTDSRASDSPYASCFAHASDFRGFDVRYLPSREHVFEFTLLASDRGEGKLQAKDIVKVPLPGHKSAEAAGSAYVHGISDALDKA